jgi:hypothetical protein
METLFLWVAGIGFTLMLALAMLLVIMTLLVEIKSLLIGRKQ